MHDNHRPGLSAAGAVLLGMGALALGAMMVSHRVRDQQRLGHSDDAPGRTARRDHFGKYAVVGKTVLIGKPRQELFAFWRDFNNLPQFMENIEAVQIASDRRSTWTIKAPLGQTVDVETDIVEERDGELIAWQSTPQSDVGTHGRVAFRDAPGGRGTYVEAIVAYIPPAGDIGRTVAKLFQREPNVQGRRELKRFKMLMETGEIATASSSHSASN